LASLNSASYDSHITSDGSGNITAIGTITFSASSAKLIQGGITILDASGGTDLTLNSPNVGGSHHIFLEIGGVKMMRFDSNGNATMLGTLTQSGTP